MLRPQFLKQLIYMINCKWWSKNNRFIWIYVINWKLKPRGLLTILAHRTQSEVAQRLQLKTVTDRARVLGFDFKFQNSKFLAKPIMYFRPLETKSVIYGSIINLTGLRRLLCLEFCSLYNSALLLQTRFLFLVVKVLIILIR